MTQPALSTSPSGGLPAGARRREADDAAPQDWDGLIGGVEKFLAEKAEEPEHAGDDARPDGAGVLFVAPDGSALFLKRAASGDHPNEWCLPGGGVEAGEDASAAARREVEEETGREMVGDDMAPLDRRTTGGVDFVTFVEPVEERFVPRLDSEHVEHVWAPLSKPPVPLHPGVEATLSADAEFEESKHRRGAGGEFSSEGSAAGSGWSRREEGDLGGRRAGASHEGSSWRESELQDYADEKPSGVDALTERQTAEGKLSDRQESAMGSVGSRKREEMPPDVFLEPAGRKYPVKEKAAGGWKFNRKLLLAAARRARMNGNEALAARADKVRGREFGGDVAATDSALKLALDKDTVREFDKDGRMHVETANICKACVSPYVGHEIPRWEDLGLDPSKVYKMLRHPDEIERAAPTANGIQLLQKHVPVDAEDHKPYDTIGAVGSKATWEHPFLKNSLHFWTKPGIDDVESEKKRELSPGYHYDADMTPGRYEGEDYDGVMRNLVFNHVALVKDGRQGKDVVVGDDAEALRWAALERAIAEMGSDARS